MIFSGNFIIHGQKDVDQHVFGETLKTIYQTGKDTMPGWDVTKTLFRCKLRSLCDCEQVCMIKSAVTVTKERFHDTKEGCDMGQWGTADVDVIKIKSAMK